MPKSLTPHSNWTRCECLVCAAVFYLQPSRVTNGRGVYCSQACWRQDMPRRRKGHKGLSRPGAANPNWRGRSAGKICPVCGKAFESINATCSFACGHKQRQEKIQGRRNRKHPARVKKCLACGALFQALGTKGCGRHFCSDACRLKAQGKSPRALNIARQLEQAGHVVELEKSWPWLHRPGIGQRMRVDLWLPTLNLAIEYDGEHHRTMAFGNSPEQFALIQTRDACKDALLAAHGVRLIRLCDWPVDLPALLAQL